MTTSFHGRPCWYELSTSSGHLKRAEEFYGGILGWTLEDAGMEGFAYHLANCDGDMVAGLMAMPGDMTSTPPHWTVYFAVDDADQTVADARLAGAAVCQEPTDIPGTGRFAMLSDPQGATFGILQPDMSGMSPENVAKAERGEGAFDQSKPGHGNWHELMSTDPVSAFAFYAGLFGWTRGDTVDMGDMGNYQLIHRDGVDIGGMMGLGNAPVPSWLPYFGAQGSVSDSAESVVARGGMVHHGPCEVPGGGYIVICQDPPGAWFALVGTNK